MDLKFHTQAVHYKYDSWLNEQLAKGFDLAKIEQIIDRAIDKNQKSKSTDSLKLAMDKEILSLKSAAINRAKNKAAL